MRTRVTQDGLSVHAIAGTEVILFGLDVPEGMAPNLLGFGFERTDRATGRREPLMGQKTFAATAPPDLAPGSPVSTLEHPVQAFLWGDYAVDADHQYTYRVVAYGGTPEHLQPLAEVEIDVTTESPQSGTHGIFFNRGVAASQSYAREFGNRPPDEVPDRRAWQWLSRGLEEALLGYIAGAEPGDTLRAAMYEFQYPAVLDTFHAAAARGVDVRIVMDAKANAKPEAGTGSLHGEPRDLNLAAIATAKIDSVTILREANPSYIAHNKFIVRIHNGKASSVWTGSTNVTDGGIFGHSNVGHVVRDAGTAQAFLDYWTQLQADPSRPKLIPWTEKIAVPEGEPATGITTIFSPRSSTEALDWYARLMADASACVFFTAAFGISRELQEVFTKDVDFLRYALLDSGANKIAMLKRDRDNVFVVGAKLDNAIGGWAAERLTGLNHHVQYIHTKFMLIDALSDDPIVITGSANFSDASSKNNDENMLVIRGDTHVADVYLTEFMRLFNHFEFRERVAAFAAARQIGQPAGVRSTSAMASGEPKTQGLQHLDPEPGWALEHFHPGWQRTKERILFR